MSIHNRLLARAVFPRLDCRTYCNDPHYSDHIDHLVSNIGVGGFVLFDGDVSDASNAITRLRDLSNNGLIFACDCEDGVTQRFAGGTEFPSMMALGASHDVAATYSVARSIAREMRTIGIHWNFAPVADINSNPANPIINIRSFGETRELVSEHVLAYIRGMQDGGVAACAKHFPGHGDTSVDTHLELAVVNADRRRLDAVELAPFREAIRNGVMSVMAAHVIVPSVDPDRHPASLSQPIVEGLLRQELGFEGVVVSDALDMDAIAKNWSVESASVASYLAGVDVLSIPANPELAVAALQKAAADGQIKARRIKATAGRITALKKWCDGFPDESPKPDGWRRGHDVIALEAARRSIGVQGRLRSLYPPVMVVAMVDDTESAKPQEWFDFFSAWYPGESAGSVITPDISEADLKSIIDAIGGAGSVVMPLFVRPRGFSGSIDLSAAQIEIARHAADRPLVVLNFGSPYLLAELEPAVRIDTFSASTASLAASIEALSRVIK